MAEYTIDKFSYGGNTYKLQDNVSGYTSNTGTVTSVGISNATNGGLSVSGSPVTGSGSITVGHSNILTNAQTTQAIYPIAIDKNGHISSYGTAVAVPNNSNWVNGSATGSVRTVGSLAESSTYTIGDYAVAEGENTTASSFASHAEGLGTTAQRKSQHVFGEYNVADTTGADGTVKGTYIEIVGKGTSNNNRSNARTLDWSGNETLAGYIKPRSVIFESSDIVDSTASIYEFGGPNNTLLQFSQEATVDDGSSTRTAIDYFSLPTTNPYVDSGTNEYVIITTKNVSTITNTAYNASTNKVATMTDINNAMTVVTFTPNQTTNNLIISVQNPSSITNGNEVSY